MRTVNKYILASSLFAILTVTLFGLYTLERYHDVETRSEGEKLEMCIRTFRELLAHKGTHYSVVDGTLMADNYRINGNFELPDKVQEIFGGVATIFMGDERVSTNVLDTEGKRTVGTRLTGPAYDAVFTQRVPYRGNATILGVPYLTAYDPIRDGDGKVVGVLFAGVKEGDMAARMHNMKWRLKLTLSCVVIVFISFMAVLLRAVTRGEEENENQISFQRTLVDTIPNPIFFKDAECRYIGCNKAFEAYSGLCKSELLGKMPHEIWDGELADCYLQQDLALLDNPGMQSYETTVTYADGTRRDVIFNKATFNDTSGSVMGMVGVLLDITERKRAEDAVAFQNVLLSTEQEASIDGILVVDDNARILSFNRRFVEIMAIPAHLLESRDDGPVLSYVSNRMADTQRFMEKVKYLYEHQQESCQDEILLSDGTVLDRYTVPLLGTDNHYYGRLWSFRDITARKAAVEEKFRLEAQLDRARLMETIMVRLGHDLKTPLTPLFALLPLLGSRISEPGLNKMVEMCIKSAVTIKNLAEKSSVLSSFSSDAEQYHFETIALISVVNKACGDCEEMISQKQIDCQTHIDPALYVQAIPTQLRELFVNLISNAVYFSSVGGVVMISAEAAADAIVISVRDEGAGLAPDHPDKIFDEFFKVDESRHDLNSSGLGLSLCKRIIQNHHGRIWAESPGLGKGTTITCTMHEQSVKL